MAIAILGRNGRTLYVDDEADDRREACASALARRVDLAGADLAGVDLHRLDFADASLADARLGGANLDGTNL
jgi:uncharacterized protein YjbI with pentapeptide repeats